MAILSFRDLIVWQKSFELTKDVYALAHKLPNTEQYGLISQVQRCAVSIPSNIAEGNQRHNRKEYAHFIGITEGSGAELETQLLLINSIYKLDVEKELALLLEVQKMLKALATKLKLAPNT